ncbi:MAG: protein tyrosine phosphatase [Eubacteriales bacterium]|nr:protein tyrosine phosphatase [Eubacteriales bacterium]
MNRFNKIIFVCIGNTCRSPMAATIMHAFLPEMLVESRGMVVLFPEPYNPKAVAVCSRHNMIMPSNCATELTGEDFSNDTLVLVMNKDMKHKIYDTFATAINVYTLGEFAGETDVEIADPYGKGAEEYNSCFEGLYRLIEKSAEILKDNKNKEDY